MHVGGDLVKDKCLVNYSSCSYDGIIQTNTTQINEYENLWDINKKLCKCEE